MRTSWALAVAVLQLGILAYMAGEREWVLRTGRIVQLRTAPVDPNDPMRGDYQRLSYEISSVPRALCRGAVLKWLDQSPKSDAVRDRRVYAWLTVGADGMAELAGLSDRAPTDGLYLRGRVEWIYGDVVNVRYGIEALFQSQKRAKEFEDRRRREMTGVPLDALVAVSPGGLPVLKDVQWESLGMTLKLERTPLPGARQPVERGIIGATALFTNHGRQAVAIVNLPQGRSFRLVPRPGGTEDDYRWVGGESLRPRADPASVIVLAPGQSHAVHLDLTTPDWCVLNLKVPAAERRPISLTALSGGWGTWFRIEYVPPAPSECAGLPQAEIIQHRRLPSAMFRPVVEYGD